MRESLIVSGSKKKLGHFRGYTLYESSWPVIRRMSLKSFRVPLGAWAGRRLFANVLRGANVGGFMYFFGLNLYVIPGVNFGVNCGITFAACIAACISA